MNTCAVLRKKLNNFGSVSSIIQMGKLWSNVHFTSRSREFDPQLPLLHYRSTLVCGLEELLLSLMWIWLIMRFYFNTWRYSTCVTR